MGESAPRYLMMIPLIFNDKTNGVVELAFFDKPESHYIDFIREFSEIFAAQLYTAGMGAQARQMLEKAEEEKKELYQRLEESEMRERKFKSVIDDLKNRRN